MALPGALRGRRLAKWRQPVAVVDERTATSSMCSTSATRGWGRLACVITDFLGSSTTLLPGPAGPSRSRLTATGSGRNFVVELYERQHSEAVPFFDKLDRMTVSGLSRGEPRALYDVRRRALVPQQGIRLVVVTLDDFGVKRGGEIVRDRDRDLAVLAEVLGD